MADFECATVGDNCIDWFIGARTFALAGGNAVNVAVHLSRLGRRAAYFGAVGADPAGQAIAHSLAENRVDRTYLRTEKGVTAFTVVERNAKGDRRFVHEEFGVGLHYHPTPGDLAALATARHVHIGWLNDDGMTRRALAAAGVSVSQDLSVNAEPRNLGVEGLSIAFASTDGPRADAVARAKGLTRLGAKLAVVTRGADGSLAFDGLRLVEIPAEPIEPVDTTGAGDSFIAGFIDARLKGASLEDCLIGGRETASACCMHVGGFPQEPPDLDPALLGAVLPQPH